jgi:hypothetical protein
MIPSNFVSQGIGLPPIFQGRRKDGRAEWFESLPQERVSLEMGPHSNPALLLQLALWCGDSGVAQAYWLIRDQSSWRLLKNHYYESETREVATFLWNAWSATCHEVSGEVPEVPYAALKAIIVHIGTDHTIRRKLGWKVERGALGTWRKAYGPPDGLTTPPRIWTLSHGEDSHTFDVGGDLKDAQNYLYILDEVTA